MTAELEQAARTLLAGRPGDGSTSKHVAERAEQLCEQLARHLSRLLGETGVRMLVKRSVTLASIEVRWLQGAVSAQQGTQGIECSALRNVMEQQEPEAITDAFVAILSTFVGLLKRLIGAGLVDDTRCQARAERSYRARQSVLLRALAACA